MKVFYEITSVKVETTAAEKIDHDIGMISVSVVLSSGSAKVQTTLSSEDDIDAETADWTDWDEGTVTGNTDAVAYAPMGIRLVNIGGTTVTMTVRGNFGS